MSKPDLNQEAARLVRQSTERQEVKLPADLEAAWTQWIVGVQKIDERIRTLLRAAFEAGAEAASLASHHDAD